MLKEEIDIIKSILKNGIYHFDWDWDLRIFHRPSTIKITITCNKIYIKVEDKYSTLPNGDAVYEEYFSIEDYNKKWFDSRAQLENYLRQQKVSKAYYEKYLKSDCILGLDKA